MTKDWEDKVLAEPGAAERVDEIESELRDCNEMVRSLDWNLRVLDLAISYALDDERLRPTLDDRGWWDDLRRIHADVLRRLAQ